MAKTSFLPDYNGSTAENIGTVWGMGKDVDPFSDLFKTIKKM